MAKNKLSSPAFVLINKHTTRKEMCHKSPAEVVKKVI